MAKFEKLQKKWAKKYRVPVVSALNPGPFYVACVVVPQKGDALAEIWNFETPTEAEAKIIGHYIVFRLRLWNSEHFIAQLKSEPLDIDRGINTISFVKARGGWRFSKASWSMGSPFWPTLDFATQYENLIELMDFEETTNGVINPRWTEFKRQVKI